MSSSSTFSPGAKQHSTAGLRASWNEQGKSETSCTRFVATHSYLGTDNSSFTSTPGTNENGESELNSCVFSFTPLSSSHVHDSRLNPLATIFHPRYIFSNLNPEAETFVPTNQRIPRAQQDIDTAEQHDINLELYEEHACESSPTSGIQPTTQIPCTTLLIVGERDDEPELQNTTTNVALKNVSVQSAGQSSASSDADVIRKEPEAVYEMNTEGYRGIMTGEEKRSELSVVHLSSTLPKLKWFARHVADSTQPGFGPSNTQSQLSSQVTIEQTVQQNNVQELHHLNFLGHHVSCKSATDPALSFTILMQHFKYDLVVMNGTSLKRFSPVTRYLSTNAMGYSMRECVMMSNAWKYIDPVIFYGSRYASKLLSGSNLRNEAIGQTSKFYAACGTWSDDIYDEDEDFPKTDCQDCKSYPLGCTVLNGADNNTSQPSRYDIWLGSDEAQKHFEHERRKISRKRRNRLSRQSSLRKSFTPESMHEEHAGAEHFPRKHLRHRMPSQNVLTRLMTETEDSDTSSDSSSLSSPSSLSLSEIDLSQLEQPLVEFQNI